MADQREIIVDFGFDTSMSDGLTIAMLVAGLAITGVASGVLAGLLGVGGGIVIVPVLFWVLGLFHFSSAVTSHLAVATSLAVIIPTSISSMRSHNKRGNVDRPLLNLWGPAIFVSALSAASCRNSFRAPACGWSSASSACWWPSTWRCRSTL
jgi:uncharacterized membrane protein YfcA